MDIQSLKAELEAQLADAKALTDELRAKVAAPVSGGLDEAALTRIVNAAAAPTNVLAQKLKPENAEARKLGPFEHPEGGEKYPKPALNGEFFFGCTDAQQDTRAMLRQRASDLTYFEVVALNELYESLGPSQRRTCRDGKWKVFVTESGEQMHLMVPIKDPDTRHDLPSFLAIIQEFKSGTRQLTPSDLAVQVARLEQQVRELQGASA